MLFASAVPLLPGKTDRYRGLGEELRPHLAEYSTLNHHYSVARHSYWISHARDGTDIGVSVYDIASDGLAAMGSRRWDPQSAYDRWWLAFVTEVNGVDLIEGSAHSAPPEEVFSWSSTG